jgi:ubiquinone/menaquinone biosynthesis C-methylase UbiE
MLDPLSAFLQSSPLVDGVYQLSAPRPFQHDESLYDAHRTADQNTTDFYRTQGATLLTFFRANGLLPDAPILEIGCGSGAMSVALATQPGAPPLLFTDPSPAFCRITREKIARHQPQAHQIRIGMLRAEDLNLLPAASVGLIFLRSVLHHILDVDGFLARAAHALLPGGMLVCEEPYYDGYQMMGFLAQFIPSALAAAGDSCSESEHQLVDTFIATMQYYARRDLDKSEAEDKHLFRPDELFVSGRAAGLHLIHYPNWHVAQPAEVNLTKRIGYFQWFFDMYLRRCMNWPPEFADRVAKVTAPYFAYFGPLESRDHTVPHCFGTFVFTKPAA